MNLLIFEYEHMAIEDLREALTNLGHTYTVITDENIYSHVDEAFDARFDKLIESASYDAVFTFNYFPVISNCCKKHNIPYIAFVYDSPLVSLYSYTIINPCNYVFLFDQQTYLELKKENIQTVYYMPLAVNTSRLDKMTASAVSASEHFNTKLFTPNPTPELPLIHNMGSVDYQRQMPYVFKNSAINLNISLRSIRSGIPLRCFDIMGCGGFLLSNYQGDFYEHFVPGEDLVLFESQEDFLNKCDYYLKHDNERRQIAANGYGKVKEFHTYEVRLKEIFKVVFSK